MSKSTPRSLTFDELLTWYQRSGLITSPSSTDERVLALSIAEAFQWAHYQTELPGGRWSDESEAYCAWSWGIRMVR
jgi:hypothetical protein